MGIRNCEIFHGTLDDFASTAQDGIRIHKPIGPTKQMLVAGFWFGAGSPHLRFVGRCGPSLGHETPQQSVLGALLLWPGDFSCRSKEIVWEVSIEEILYREHVEVYHQACESYLPCQIPTWLLPIPIDFPYPFQDPNDRLLILFFMFFRLLSFQKKNGAEKFRNQVASLKIDHQRGEGTMQRMHPCSQAQYSSLKFKRSQAKHMRNQCRSEKPYEKSHQCLKPHVFQPAFLPIWNEITCQAMQAATSNETFAWCAKAADFTPGKGGGFDAESSGFQTDGGAQSETQNIRFFGWPILSPKVLEMRLFGWNRNTKKEKVLKSFADDVWAIRSLFYHEMSSKALRCMRIVDTDRLLLAREDGCFGSKSSGWRELSTSDVSLGMMIGYGKFSN